MKRHIASLYTVVALVGASVTYAQDSTPIDQDMAFLEFLGEWEDDNGEWLDPMNFDDQDNDEHEKESDHE